MWFLGVRIGEGVFMKGVYGVCAVDARVYGVCAVARARARQHTDFRVAARLQWPGAESALPL